MGNLLFKSQKRLFNRQVLLKVCSVIVSLCLYSVWEYGTLEHLNFSGKRRETRKTMENQRKRWKSKKTLRKTIKTRKNRGAPHSQSPKLFESHSRKVPGVPESQSPRLPEKRRKTRKTKE